MPRRRTHPDDRVPALRESLAQFGRLVRLLRPYWGAIFKGSALGGVLGLLGMLPPYATKLLIDEVYPSRNATLLEVLVGGTLAVTAASIVIGGLRSYYTAYFGAQISNSTGLLFFNHLQHLGARFFDEHRVGEILSRFSDVKQSLSAVSAVFGTFLVQGIYLVIVPPFLFLLEWRLALAALVGVPGAVILTTLTARVLRKYQQRAAESYAELNGMQVEALSHIRMVKTLALEPYVYARAAAQVRLGMREQLRAAGVGQLLGAVGGVLGAVGTAFFTWYGWTLILRGEMTLGAYIAFMAYLAYFTRPLAQFTTLFADFQRSGVHLARMYEYLDLAAEQDPAGAYEPHAPLGTPLCGHVELRGICFGYTPDRRVLHDVDLELAPGTVTAVIGPSGAGKSSLVRLLCRMEAPDGGEMLLDGAPAARLPLSEHRRQVAVALQEVSLLRGTIWDNLTAGVPGVTRAQADEVMALCRLDALLAELPAGYDTPVAEWGASLSGGQRQRVSLARVLLRRPPVILLDEATANVDMETEAAILRDLFARTRREGTTVLWVTHRVATVSLADQVCLLEGGRVVARGTHEHLLRTSEAYARAAAGAAEPARRPRRPAPAA